MEPQPVDTHLKSPCCQATVSITGNKLICTGCGKELTVTNANVPNFSFNLEGAKMTVAFEVNEVNPAPSNSGRSNVIFTSHGFKWLKGYGFNITVIKPLKK
jgi:hypothetical protein